MKSMNIDEMREYMSRPEGNCWVGVDTADGYGFSLRNDREIYL